MAKRNKLLLLIAIFVSLFYQVKLASAFPDIPNIIARGVNYVIIFLQNSMNRAFIVLLGFFVLLLAVFKVAIQRVKIFQDGKGGLNNQGKAVMIVLATGGFIGIMFASPDGFYRMVEKFLEMSRIYGLVALGLLTFWLVYAALGIGGDE